MSKNKSEDVIEKIKKNFLKHETKSINDYIINNNHYLIYEFMIITYSEKDNIVDIAFNVSTRSDISAFFALLLSKIHNFDDVRIMEVFSSDKNGKILSGNDCIKNHQERLKDKIVNDFLTDQFQTHYLRTIDNSGVC